MHKYRHWRRIIFNGWPLEDRKVRAAKAEGGVKITCSRIRPSFRTTPRRPSFKRSQLVAVFRRPGAYFAAKVGSTWRISAEKATREETSRSCLAKSRCRMLLRGQPHPPFCGRDHLPPYHFKDSWSEFTCDFVACFNGEVPVSIALVFLRDIFVNRVCRVCFSVGIPVSDELIIHAQVEADDR